MDLQYIKLLYTKIYSDFQQFIYTNNILVTAAGFAIGMATHQLISDNIKIITSFISSFYKKLTFNNKNVLWFFEYSVIMFFINIFIWIITIILSFVLLEYLLYNKFFGLKSTVKEEDKKDFIISKSSAKKIELLPSQNELKNIELKQKTDDIIGDKMVKHNHDKEIQKSFEILQNNESFQLYDHYMPLLL